MGLGFGRVGLFGLVGFISVDGGGLFCLSTV